MSQQEQQDTPDGDRASASSGTGQQQQQPQSEGHTGHGSESIMKELREWEDRRASHSGAKHRPGAG
ncbi:hypothetical protein [Ramlibacter alkalitolerans]|uniref:Uncharacterized protein n=1 Tax=Ramlibacter alkalitolerans TaxID=2039631 RepID=A0ABS1JQP0_9BURK|nr:hypothetical protein [Ramlibacter alkalitolerans]MBL0426593.1 hypothetical protein [Ramlibacter alkalitolerans]